MNCLNYHHHEPAAALAN